MEYLVADQKSDSVLYATEYWAPVGRIIHILQWDTCDGQRGGDGGVVAG